MVKYKIPLPYIDVNESNSKLYTNSQGFTRSCILHTLAFGTYLLGRFFTLQKKKEGDGILHVNIFQYFKIPYLYVI